MHRESPGVGESEFLLICGNAGLRAALRKNAVSFPSQMVRLRGCSEGGDEPERIVQLYFVHGWSVGSICQRYGLTRKTVENILTKWRQRAVAAGFVQEIPAPDREWLSLREAGAEVFARMSEDPR